MHSVGHAVIYAAAFLAVCPLWAALRYTSPRLPLEAIPITIGIIIWEIAAAIWAMSDTLSKRK